MGDQFDQDIEDRYGAERLWNERRTRLVQYLSNRYRGQVPADLIALIALDCEHLATTARWDFMDITRRDRVASLVEAS